MQDAGIWHLAQVARGTSVIGCFGSRGVIEEESSLPVVVAVNADVEDVEGSQLTLHACSLLASLLTLEASK